MQTFLQIINQAEMELGLPVSTSVFGNITSSTTGGITDNTGIQMGALANRVLDEMRRMNPIGWTAMQFEFDLVVSVPITVTGDLQPISPIITNISPNTTGILPYVYQVAGSGIPVASRVLSVDSSTQITMTMENTNTTLVPGATLLFSRDTYPMPVGFDWFQNRTMWDRTNRWELLGPDSPQMDQWHRSGIVVTGPRRHFRQLGVGGTPGLFANEFRIWPAPAEISEPLQLVFEYLSNAAVNVDGMGNTFAVNFANDDDVPLLDDQALIMGIKWMFWEVKGFGSYVTLQQRWVDYVQRLIGRDGAAPTLNIVKRINPIFISPANVQDGFFPGPVGPNMG
jgi:hypothetical protein